MNNGSYYDFYLMMKHLAEEFEANNFKCLGKNA